MADQNTTNYSFVKPEIGASEDTWGEKLNDNWDSADTEIKALEDSKVNNTGAETITGVKTFSDGIVSNVTGNVTGNLTGDAATLNGFTAAQIIPSGLISMWSGTITNIPDGWSLCNGSNGTPDLRERFVYGASLDSDVNAVGGSKDSVVVAHTHTTPDHTHTASSSTSGNHRHNILRSSNAYNVSGGIYGHDATNTSNQTNGYTEYAGDHSHAITINSGGAGTTGSTGESGVEANLPPYVKLAFIMKL